MVPRSAVEGALLALSDGDLMRLKRIAQLRSFGLEDYGWDDLLQEAISRALAGTRVWPQDVPLVAFLAQTMRSISHEARNSPGQERVDRMPAQGNDGIENGIASATLADVAIDEITPERQTAAGQALKRIEAAFAGDSEALAVLHALGEGLTPEEALVKAKLSRVSYESAQRRIRRKVAKMLDQGDLS